MYSCSPSLSSISLEKFLWKSVFSNFGHVTIFAKQKFVFLDAILKQIIFWMFFLLIYGFFRCIQIWCKFHTKIPTGKYLKMVRYKWTPLPCTQISCLKRRSTISGTLWSELPSKRRASILQPIIPDRQWVTKIWNLSQIKSWVIQ